MKTPMPLSRRWKILRNTMLVFCLLELGFAFIPDIGAYAMLLGGLTVILSVILFVKSIRTGTSKLISIITLILSLASIGVSYWTFIRTGFNFTIQPGWDTILIKH